MSGRQLWRGAVAPQFEQSLRAALGAEPLGLKTGRALEARWRVVEPRFWGSQWRGTDLGPEEGRLGDEGSQGGRAELQQRDRQAAGRSGGGALKGNKCTLEGRREVGRAGEAPGRGGDRRPVGRAGPQQGRGQHLGVGAAVGRPGTVSSV